MAQNKKLKKNEDKISISSTSIYNCSTISHRHILKKKIPGDSKKIPEFLVKFRVFFVICRLKLSCNGKINSLDLFSSSPGHEKPIFDLKNGYVF